MISFLDVVTALVLEIGCCTTAEGLRFLEVQRGTIAKLVSYPDPPFQETSAKYCTFIH